MDRRQRKTREAIFNAFSSLVSKKDYLHVTVGEIIEKADVGRATFYAHFETKDVLLKEFCRELFCHIFDTAERHMGHRHIFDCDAEESVFLHLFRHLMRNDNNILSLLFSENNGLFLSYFSRELENLIDKNTSLFDSSKIKAVPRSLWQSHVTMAFTETLKWWVRDGKKEPPDTIYEYFTNLIR